MSFLRNPQSGSFLDEPDLRQRIEILAGDFARVYGAAPEICVRSPGRAEILGNHTDYNNGFALAAPISRSIVALLRRRADRIVTVGSNAFPRSKSTFSLDSISQDPSTPWTNYVRGIAKELLDAGHPIGGADILLGANLPTSGGVSSSAALELAIAEGLVRLYDISVEKLSLALLSKSAENGPLVGTPCGLLDQATVALGERGKVVLLDFAPKDGSPLGVRLIPTNLSPQGYSFVVTVDAEVKRNLGETGYPARRKMCEESVPILSDLIGKPLTSLRDLTVDEFESVRRKLEATGGKIMRMRVEHVVYENQRVLKGASLIESGDIDAFGALLTEAGHSALDLYGLDDETPELTFLVNTQMEFDGISGTRNMGGGFSAITLSLMRKNFVPDFVAQVGSAYRAKWLRSLEFIEFSCTQGVEVL